jgi:hypothetical protein
MTNRFRVSAALLAAIAGGIVASSANAEIIATVSYDDLAGNFVSSGGGNGQFTATAVNTANLASAYEASRLTPAAGSASFEAGFVSNPFNPADFQISINVVNINATTASGTGHFTATDADGDTLDGDISGLWIFGGPGFIFFNGNLSNVLFADNGAADNTFDGTEAGDFGMSFPSPQPYFGSVVQLTFGGNNFFRTDFSDRATGGSMQVLPTPGSFALMGLAGLAVASRRRAR